VDVFAAKDGRIRMIQVKSGRGRLKPADRETLKRWALAFAGTAEVWYFGKRVGTVIEIVFEAGSEG
jgi:hypothetical protein